MLAALEPGLAARERQQRVDHLLELLLGGEHALVGRAQRGEVRVRVGERDLDQRSLACQRRAQLVRGVGDELTLRLERSFEPPKQVIERVPEFLELVLRAVQGQALVQAGGGDPPAVRVMVRIGRSILPATSQPARRASTATIARAIPELTRSWCESAARCAAWTDPACAT